MTALDLVRKLRLTQGLDNKEEDEFAESEGKDEIRNKILSIMDQVRFGTMSSKFKTIKFSMSKRWNS